MQTYIQNLCSHLWSTWIHRNHVIFNKITPSVNTIAILRNSFSEDWKPLLNKIYTSSKHNHLEQTPSRINHPSVYRDGSILLSHNPSHIHTGHKNFLLIFDSDTSSPNTWNFSIIDCQNNKHILHTNGALSDSYTSIVLENLILALIIAKPRRPDHIFVITNVLFSQVWSRFITPLLKSKIWEQEVSIFLKDICSFWWHPSRNGCHGNLCELNFSFLNKLCTSSCYQTPNEEALQRVIL